AAKSTFWFVRNNFWARRPSDGAHRFRVLVELEYLPENARRNSRHRVHLQPRLVERSHDAERDPDQAAIPPVAKYLADDRNFTKDAVQPVDRHECAGHVGVILSVKQRALERQADRRTPYDAVG